MGNHVYSEALRHLGPILAQHSYGLDMLRELAFWERNSEDPASAEFDTAEAIYYHGSRWHRGQGCPLYSALSTIGFRPGPLWRRPERNSIASTLAASFHQIARKMSMEQSL